MDVLKKIEWLRAQIKSQEKVRAKFMKENNEKAANAASRKIRKHQDLLNKLI